MKQIKATLPIQTQKLIASLLHLVFLCIMFIGIGIMYLNDNFGVGITRVKNVPYEDTAAFNQQFNTDLEDIFHYIEYRDTFSASGTVDVSRQMLQMTFGPNETEVFTLADLLSYLQSLGYQMSDDFQCQLTAPPASGASARDGYVDWSASEPKKLSSYNTPGTRRASLETISLEIMEVLHRYYLTYNRLIATPGNFHFKIEYLNQSSSDKKGTIYSNDMMLTVDNLRDYGKYAYLPGNSVFYDTNFNSISLGTVSSLSAGNPYEGNAYYLLAAVDTTYPEQDLYSEGRTAYLNMQHYYIIGFVLMIVGGIILLVTLLFLLRVSGHASAGSRTITLHSFDQMSAELGIVLFGLLSLAALGLCRLTLVRIVHLILPRDTWYLSEQVLYAGILYLALLLLFFSLLRRYKAGVLWNGSFICRAKKRLSILVIDQSFTGRLLFGFLSYLILNSSLVSLAWFLWDRNYLGRGTRFVLTALILLACAAFNLWIFYLLFKRSLEQEQIHTAIERLAAGETNYQVNLDEFEGRELKLAEGLNNISAGLDAALSEKVKSERLKADLITNVSHDIKTPLTSIINYVNLIKREPIEDEKILRYLDVLEQKSLRLKTLTEDLVEASKASSGNLTLEISDINLTELIYQTNGEFEEKFAAHRLELITSAPDETILIEADGRRLWRVLENLYNNAYKYAMEGSRIYADLAITESEFGTRQVHFTIKNVSANPLNIRPDELTERFVRGDVARTTEGSGLGLSIAKSLTELQKGQFTISIDGDLFKVQLTFPVKESSL